MVQILRRASKAPKKLTLDDEGSYIEVTEDVTRRQFNRIVDAMPQAVTEEDISLTSGMQLQQVLFDTFVTGWSLGGEPTVEEYLDLPAEASTAIDNALMTHFSGLQVSEEEVKSRRQSTRTAQKG